MRKTTMIQKIMILLLTGLILLAGTACAGNALGTTGNPAGAAAVTTAGGKSVTAATTAAGQNTVQVVIQPPAGWAPVSGSILAVQYLKDTASFMVKEESQLTGKSLSDGVNKALEVLGQAFKDMSRVGDIESITVDGQEARKVIFICTVGKLAMKYEYVYLIAGGRFFAITFGDSASHFDVLTADYAQILKDIRFSSQSSAAPATTAATRTTTPTAATKVASAATSGKADGAAKSYIRLLQGGQYLMRYQVTATVDDESVKAEITMAVSGQTVATIMAAGDEQMHSLLKDNQVFLLDDEAKTYLKMDLGANLPAAGSDLFENTADIAYIGQGTGTVNNRQLPYEEYSAAGETLRFFLDGQNLYAISTGNDGDTMEMIVLEFTGKIPAGLLEIPAGYQETDFQ